MFYDDAYKPSEQSKDNPNGILVLSYQNDNSEDFLFVDGSVLSISGDYREMNSFIEPKKQLSLSLNKKENGDYQLKVIDESSISMLNNDGSSYLYIKDEKGADDLIPRDQNETKSDFKDKFGLQVDDFISGLKQKTKQDLKSDNPSSMLSLFSSFIKGEDKSKNKSEKKNNKLKF